MRLLGIFLRMLRIRVTLTLLIFYALGLAWNNAFSAPATGLLYGAIAIIFAYGSATSFNDLADVTIDKINLKGAKDRLLANEQASAKDILTVALISATLSVACGFLATPKAAICLIAAFIVNVTYSLRPVRISYRPLLVPFYLSIAYVAIPWVTAAVISNGAFTRQSFFFVIGLCLLFMARISLKDFRDRVGDKAHGKPTAVLVYGKPAVISFATLSLILGLYLTVTIIHAAIWERVALGFLGILGLRMLWELAHQSNLDQELLAIGMGARFGNGLLFGMLGILLLNSSQASSVERLIFLFSVVVLFGWLWIDFHIRPQNYSYGGGGYKIPAAKKT